MYVPESMRINKFVDVRIPSNKDYFARLGQQALPDGQYTGEHAAVMPSDKVTQITAEEQRIFDDMRQKEEDAARAAAAAAAAKSKSKSESPED